MSATYQSGVEFLKSYSGILKVIEVGLHGVLIVLTTVQETSFQAQFLCGLSIYGFVSAIVLLSVHLRGMIKNSNFPWFWVECFNSGMVALLLLGSSTLVVAVLTRGYVVTGVIGYTTVLVYVLDAMEKFSVARTPRARYVWTTPNMPI